MATRMQQRRGTAAQWTAANPILAAGEIGFETDTSKFKMGNGSSTWSALTYFANAAELAAIIEGAPALLNTLDELALALGDDPNFLTALATNARVDGVVTGAASALSDATAYAVSQLSTHTNGSQNVHGIPDTSLLATKLYADGKAGEAATTAATDASTKATTAKSEAITAANEAADQKIITAINAIPAITSATLGLGEVDNTQDAFKPVSAAQAFAIDTAKTEAITAAGIAADSKVSAHDVETLNIHGIADTAVLVTQTDLSNALLGAVVDQSSLAGVGIDWNSVSEAFDVDETYITNATETELDLKAPKASPTFTGIVSGVTKAHVGLADVDNTSDTAKPVSTAQASAIATAKSEAIASATAQVDALLTGSPAALNTLDELAAALGDDANFASSVTTSLGLKAPLASPTFTGTVTVAAEGVAFTDATQTKAGVPSITTIVQKTESYTLSSLTERDNMIEVASGSGKTITVPLNSEVAYPVGTAIDILQTSSGQVTIAGVQGVTINATPGLKLRTQWSGATLLKRAENTWVLSGDLTA